MRIKETCVDILNKSTELLADTERNADITFHDNETIGSLEQRFNEIILGLEKLSKEFRCGDNECVVIGKPIIKLLEQINSNLVQYSTNNQENISMEAESDTEKKLENVVFSILKPMETIYKKYAKQKKVPAGDVPNETASNEMTEPDPIEENHLKTKINYELMSELEILNVEKVTKKLADILLTMESGNCSNAVNLMEKIIRILPILEQYSLFCKFFLIQQIGAHKVSTKMLSVMLTVFVELGSKVLPV